MGADCERAAVAALLASTCSPAARKALSAAVERSGASKWPVSIKCDACRRVSPGLGPRVASCPRAQSGTAAVMTATKTQTKRMAVTSNKTKLSHVSGRRKCRQTAKCRTRHLYGHLYREFLHTRVSRLTSPSSAPNPFGLAISGDILMIISGGNKPASRCLRLAALAAPTLWKRQLLVRSVKHLLLFDPNVTGLEPTDSVASNYFTKRELDLLAAFFWQRCHYRSPRRCHPPQSDALSLRDLSLFQRRATSVNEV
jgi:hypothetical protein